MFQFRNMQNFIRNCIEPHAVALNQLLMSQRKWIQEELDLLKKSNKTAMDQLIELINRQINDQNNQIAGKIDSLSSIETVGIWPVSTRPHDSNKWFICDGSGYSTSTYRKLWEVLQSPYLPDYRGLFLRGVGGNSAGLGVRQGDDLKSHNHYMHMRGGEGGGGPNERIYFAQGTYEKYTATTGGTETRPVNKAVQFWIRATN